MQKPLPWCKTGVCTSAWVWTAKPSCAWMQTPAKSCGVSPHHRRSSRRPRLRTANFSSGWATGILSRARRKSSPRRRIGCARLGRPRSRSPRRRVRCRSAARSGALISRLKKWTGVSRPIERCSPQSSQARIAFSSPRAAAPFTASGSMANRSRRGTPTPASSRRSRSPGRTFTPSRRMGGSSHWSGRACNRLGKRASDQMEVF